MANVATRALVHVYRDDGRWDEYDRWFMRDDSDLIDLHLADVRCDCADEEWDEALADCVALAKRTYPGAVLVY